MPSQTYTTSAKPRKGKNLSVRFDPYGLNIRTIPTEQGTWAYDRPLGNPEGIAKQWSAKQMEKARTTPVPQLDRHDHLPAVPLTSDRWWHGKVERTSTPQGLSASGMFENPNPNPYPSHPTNMPQRKPLPVAKDVPEVREDKLGNWEDDDRRSRKSKNTFASVVTMASGLKKVGLSLMQKAPGK